MKLDKKTIYWLYLVFVDEKFPSCFKYEALRNSMNFKSTVQERDELIKGLLSIYGTDEEKSKNFFDNKNPKIEEVQAKLKEWGDEEVEVNIFKIKQKDLEKLKGLDFDVSMFSNISEYFIDNE